MKTFDPATQAYLARRAGYRARVLAYVWATNRSTSAIEQLGLWSGEQDRTFTIGTETRLYARAAGILKLEEIVAQPGTDVIFTQLVLSSIDERVINLMRVYEPRFAPIEIHRALFWPDTGALVAAPIRLFKGWIDSAPLPTPSVGETADMTVSLASANRALTRTLPFAKSDGALRQARSADRFRRYQDVVQVSVPWGEKRSESGGKA